MNEATRVERTSEGVVVHYDRLDYLMKSPDEWLFKHHQGSLPYLLLDRDLVPSFISNAVANFLIKEVKEMITVEDAIIQAGGCTNPAKEPKPFLAALQSCGYVVVPGNHIVPTSSSVVLCRGSWALGTACGRCERCRDEAVKMMPSLLRNRDTLDAIRSLIYHGSHGFSYSNEHKLACYAEAGRILREE